MELKINVRGISSGDMKVDEGSFSVSYTVDELLTMVKAYPEVMKEFAKVAQAVLAQEVEIKLTEPVKRKYTRRVKRVKRVKK